MSVVVVKGKKSKSSIWEAVKAEDKDFFFNSLEKKKKNCFKKLKEIERLEEELKEDKELKPE